MIYQPNPLRTYAEIGVLSLEWIDLEVVTGQIAYFRSQQEAAEDAVKREMLIKAIDEAESQRQRVLNQIFHKYMGFAAGESSGDLRLSPA
jgi:hypothetical protein